MTNKNNELNDLIHYLGDSYRGLRECAKQTELNNLNTCLEKIAYEREKFQQVLISYSDSEIDTSGTLLGPLHRMYIDIKANLVKDNNQALKEEILRGDKVLIEKYNETIQQVQLSKDLYELLNNQLKAVHHNLAEITQAISDHTSQ